LAYDDVLPHHREIIYTRRHKILFDDTEYLDTIYQQLLAVSPEDRSVIEEKRSSLGEEVFLRVFKDITLQIIDRLWMEHLEVMGDTRQSVNLRAYGQREPIVEYKKESMRLFHEFEHTWLHDIADILKRIDVQATLKPKVQAVEIVSPVSKKSDIVIISKGNETKEVKRKKVQQWLDTGWTERG
jgi:preprotein translocase subunit SecA